VYTCPSPLTKLSQGDCLFVFAHPDIVSEAVKEFENSKPLAKDVTRSFGSADDSHFHMRSSTVDDLYLSRPSNPSGVSSLNATIRGNGGGLASFL